MEFRHIFDKPAPSQEDADKKRRDLLKTLDSGVEAWRQNQKEDFGTPDEKLAAVRAAAGQIRSVCEALGTDRQFLHDVCAGKDHNMTEEETARLFQDMGWPSSAAGR